MTTFKFITGFCALAFVLCSPGTSSAKSIVCWDGTIFVDPEACNHRAPSHTFDIFGLSTGGGLVSAYVNGDSLWRIDISTFGDMGKIDYSLVRDSITVRETHYNMPFYMAGFDPNQSKLSLIEVFKITKSDDGNVTVIEDSLEKNEKRANRLACIINAVTRHLSASNGTPKDLTADCN